MGNLNCLSTMLSLINLETLVFNSWPDFKGVRSNVHLQDTKHRNIRTVESCKYFPIYYSTSGCFNFFSNLRTLKMENIKLARLYENSSICVGENALEKLSIRGSEVLQPGGGFRNLKNLKFFDASDLVLGYKEGPVLRPDAFFDLKALEVLLIRGCRLHTLKYQELLNIVASNSQLNVLDMSSNHLSFLPPDTFVNNKNLKYLDLSDNCFQQLDLNFKDAAQLKVLNFKRNTIQDIKGIFVDSIKKISTNRSLTLLLTDNTIKCSCNFIVLTGLVSNKSIIECFLKNKKYTFENFTDIPDELNDLCKPVLKTLAVTESFGIAFGTLSGILFALVIIFCVVRRKHSKKPNNLT